MPGAMKVPARVLFLLLTCVAYFHCQVVIIDFDQNALFEVVNSGVVLGLEWFLSGTVRCCGWDEVVPQGERLEGQSADLHIFFGC